MKIKVENILLTLIGVVVFTPLLALISHWHLSKPINDPVVQNFYRMLANEENELGLPQVLHEKVIELSSDGFSTKDYLEFSTSISIYCGGNDPGFMHKQLNNIFYGFTSFITSMDLVHYAMASTDGKVMINQLDATLCNKIG